MHATVPGSERICLFVFLHIGTTKVQICGAYMQTDKHICLAMLNMEATHIKLTETEEKIKCIFDDY